MERYPAFLTRIPSLVAQLDLSNNQLCGYKNGSSAFTAVAASAIAEALHASTSLTTLNLSDNNLLGLVYVAGRDLDGGSALQVGATVEHNGKQMVVVQEKDSEGDVEIGTMEALNELAGGLRASSSLVCVDLRGNGVQQKPQAALRGALTRDVVLRFW